MSLIVGRSFTAVTVSSNVSLALAVPSLTVTVIVALPDWFAAGVIVIVRFAPEPPNMIPPGGTKIGFEDVACTAKSPAGLSRSPTVNVIADVAVSSSVS